MTTLADLSPALIRVGHVLRANDGHHEGAWRQQTVAEHVRHALAHLDAWQASGQAEPHLDHALCRLLFAVTLEESKR